MLGAHRLSKLAAALAIGSGIALSCGVANAGNGLTAVEASGPLVWSGGAGGGLPQNMAAFAHTSHKVSAASLAGGKTAESLFNLGGEAQYREAPRGLFGIDDAGTLAHAFADMPAAPKLVLGYGEDGATDAEMTPLPIPGTVWLFLAALALLFGLSRRQIVTGR